MRDQKVMRAGMRNKEFILSGLSIPSCVVVYAYFQNLKHPSVHTMLKPYIVSMK